MSTPDETLLDYIASQVGSLTEGTNLFQGPPRGKDEGDYIPDECVFVMSTGGPAPDAFLGETEAMYYHGLQIRVRSARGKFQTGQTLARTVRDAAHYAPLSGYVDVRVTESSPNYLGVTEDMQHEWSITVEAVIKE